MDKALKKYSVKVWLGTLLVSPFATVVAALFYRGFDTVSSIFETLFFLLLINLLGVFVSSFSWMAFLGIIWIVDRWQIDVIIKRLLLGFVAAGLTYPIFYLNDLMRMDMVVAYCLTASLAAFFLFPQKESNQPA